jgi:hypothetical protein
VRLPNGERAEIGTKLVDYALNPQHRDGRNKARVFASALGISQSNADVLARALLDAAAKSESAEAKGDNGYGEVYVLRCVVTTEVGAATVASVWIIRRGEDFPRLTTCYIQ